MLNHGKSSGIISNNKRIHLSLCYNYYYTIQGRNEPVQWGSNSPGNEITMGHQITMGHRMTAGRQKFPTMSQILHSIQ